MVSIKQTLYLVELVLTLIFKRLKPLLIVHIILLLFASYYKNNLIIFIFLYLYITLTAFLIFLIATRKTDNIFFKIYNIPKSKVFISKYATFLIYQIFINIILYYI